MAALNRRVQLFSSKKTTKFVPFRQILPRFTFGGADKKWNVPYGLPLFKAVFTKAPYTNKDIIKENRGLKLIKKEKNVPAAGGTQPLGDSSICFNLSGLITYVTLLVVCVDFLRWLAV